MKRFVCAAAAVAAVMGAAAAQAQSDAAPKPTEVRLLLGGKSAASAATRSSERGVSVYRGKAPAPVELDGGAPRESADTKIVIVNNIYRERYYGLRTQGFYSGIPYGRPRFTQGFYSGGPRGS